MCQDGGKIWECDERDCQRAVCSKCIEIPSEEIKKLKDQNVKFRCVSCHWKMSKDMYFVSFFFFNIKIYLIFTGFHQE
jgi:hypothetical protein